jgi:hypothetical protein
MNNKPETNNTAKGVRRKRSRYQAPLSERLATVRSYPGFASSALTGFLR